MEYLCHKWQRICSVCRNHNPILSSLMTYHRGGNKSNTMGATCGAGLLTLPEHLSSPLVSRSLFVLFPIVLSVLWFTASDYPFGIFKLLKLTNKMYYKHLSLVYQDNCHWLKFAENWHWLKFADNYHWMVQN